MLEPLERTLLSLASHYRIEVEIEREPTRYFLTDPLRGIVETGSLFEALKLLGTIGARA